MSGREITHCPCCGGEAASVDNWDDVSGNFALLDCEQCGELEVSVHG